MIAQDVPIICVGGVGGWTRRLSTLAPESAVRSRGGDCDREPPADGFNPSARNSAELYRHACRADYRRSRYPAEPCVHHPIPAGFACPEWRISAEAHLQAEGMARCHHRLPPLFDRALAWQAGCGDRVRLRRRRRGRLVRHPKLRGNDDRTIAGLSGTARHARQRHCQRVRGFHPGTRRDRRSDHEDHSASRLKLIVRPGLSGPRPCTITINPRTSFEVRARQTAHPKTNAGAGAQPLPAGGLLFPFSLCPRGRRRGHGRMASLLAADEVPQIIGQFQPILAAHVHHVAGVVIVELGAAFGPAGAVH